MTTFIKSLIKTLTVPLIQSQARRHLCPVQKERALLLLLCALTFVLGGCSQTPSGTSSPSSEVSGGETAVPAPTAPSSSVSDGEESLTVHFIDVGQGDCILAQSEGHFMLIDAGENDQGDTVISYLNSQGVKELDYVIGTHPHSDHIGGLDKVIEAFPTKQVILPPIEHTTQTFEDVLDAISARGLKITNPIPGDIYPLGNASFTILSPVKDYGDDLNNWSVGIRLTCGSRSFVMCGDAESQAEEDMIANGAILKADVLKAGHHGSSTSTSDLFLEKVDPSYVVIQCGEGNSYGHPHKETMEKLEKAGCWILRTDLLGTIVASTDGDHLTWSPQAGESMTEGGRVSDPSSYVINTNTRKFHRPDCPSAAKMKGENRQEREASRETLIEEGYEPCGQCSP